MKIIVSFLNGNIKSKSLQDSKIMKKKIFDMCFLLLISDKEVMASSLPLRSIFLDLPGAQGRVPKLAFPDIAKNNFVHLILIRIFSFAQSCSAVRYWWWLSKNGHFWYQRCHHQLLATFFLENWTRDFLLRHKWISELKACG